MGLSGQPSARAIRSGIASTTGVVANDCGSGTSAWPCESATSAVQVVDAGDQITGWGLVVWSVGQPCFSRRLASPELTLTGTMVAHLSRALPSGDSLNLTAISVNMFTFSGDTAATTRVQPSKSPSLGDVGFEVFGAPLQALSSMVRATVSPPMMPRGFRFIWFPFQEWVDKNNSTGPEGPAAMYILR